ncbi:MAG: T9SS type A sorting domain-containing protein [Bacteroidales bacterium]|nr:T9SS type A sorting domain-containing protein [Bacteroidales bacterium]
MKPRISLLVWVALFFGTGGAAAQSHYYHLVNDTVYGRSPIYYYDWWPPIDSNGLVQDSIIFPEKPYHIEVDYDLDGPAVNDYKQGLYQRHTTVTPLKVIGIASTLTRYYWDTSDTRWGQLTFPMDSLPEDVDTVYDTTMHYILFAATPAGPVELARVCWTDDYMTHPKRYMALPNTEAHNSSPVIGCENITSGYRIAPLREYYFNSPVWVTDSFYLGWAPMKRRPVIPYTWLPNYDEIEARGWYYYLHYYENIALGNWLQSGYCKVHIPTSSFLFIRNLVNGYMYDEDPIFKEAEGQIYLTIFPIIEIDSTKVPYNPADFCCPVPSNLSTVIHQSYRLKVGWDALNNFEWELAITTSDSLSPDSCSIIPCSTNSYDTYGIHPDSTYYVYVRGRCEVIRWTDTMWSDWSAPLVVEALNGSGPDDPPDPGDTTAIRSAEGPAFSLSPNPANATVTVVTAETDGTVALLDLQGRMLFAVPLTGDETVVDLRTLPPGTYLVRVSTPRGSTTQKLTVGR